VIVTLKGNLFFFLVLFVISGTVWLWTVTICLASCESDVKVKSVSLQRR